MAIADADRYQLHQRLDEVLGPDHARTMMEFLPPVGWADVARRVDVERLGADVDRLGTRMERLEGSVRSDMERLGGSLTAHIERVEGSVRSDLGHRIEQLETSLRSEMQIGASGLRQELSDGLRVATLANMATMTALAGVIVAAIRL
jgi:hypothetical protein